MSTLTKMTRTVKKLEVPRPLKSTTSTAHNRNSVLDVKINSGKSLIGIVKRKCTLLLYFLLYKKK